MPLTGIDSYGPVIGTSHPGAVGESRSVDGSNGFLIASRDGKLWEAAAAGDLTDEAEQALAPELLSVRRPYASNYEIGQFQLGPYTQTLAGRTLLEFGENRGDQPGPPPDRRAGYTGRRGARQRRVLERTRAARDPVRGTPRCSCCRRTRSSTGLGSTGTC